MDPFPLGRDDALGPQDCQMLGKIGLADGHLFEYLRNHELLFPEHVHDLETFRAGKGAAET